MHRLMQSAASRPKAQMCGSTDVLPVAGHQLLLVIIVPKGQLRTTKPIVHCPKSCTLCCNCASQACVLAQRQVWQSQTKLKGESVGYSGTVQRESPFHV